MGDEPAARRDWFSELVINPHIIKPFWPGDDDYWRRLNFEPFQRWEEEQARLRRERGEPDPPPPPAKRPWWARLLRRGAAA